MPRRTQSPKEAKKAPGSRRGLNEFSACVFAFIPWQKPPLALGRSIALGNSVPVDDVKERSDLVGAAVLVVEVVSMLPNIKTQDRRVAGHVRIVLVRGAFDH